MTDLHACGHSGKVNKIIINSGEVQHGSILRGRGSVSRALVEVVHKHSL